ncbi:LOW QUALITY PROTEIN: hypothetical protein ACHAWF_002140 [Thalassiosira exigua]
MAPGMEDFAHTGYSSRPAAGGSKETGSKGATLAPVSTPSPRTVARADVEHESNLPDLRLAARPADESVEDAAGKLFSVMSRGDTTLCSARIAAESCLLSGCRPAAGCLRSLAALERAELNDRLRRTLSARSTASTYGTLGSFHSRGQGIAGGTVPRGGGQRRRRGGGAGRAQQPWRGHVEGGRRYRNVEWPSHFEGWGQDDGSEEEEEEDDGVEPEIYGDIFRKLFGGEASPGVSVDKIGLASDALAERSERGQSFRKSVLYELNSQRSKKTRLEVGSDFDVLCRMFDSFLTGCGRESVDLSDAKMLMMLSQTFYFVDDKVEDEGGREQMKEGKGEAHNRESRMYVKSRICHHGIWSDEDFWDQAVYQCVSESLAKSGVLSNYVQSEGRGDGDGSRTAGRDHRGDSTLKWHDLAPEEYSDAAAQVHSVVFAQLGTLSRENIVISL